jgi:hypothetical protein
MRSADHPARLAFGPDDIDAMATALDAACNVLRLNQVTSAGSADDMRTLLALRILQRAQKGESNYGRLLMVALDGFISNDISARSREPI